MDRDLAKAIVENILFISSAPVSTDRLATLFDGELGREEIKEVLGELEDDYKSRALSLAEVAEGWRVQTRREYAGWITRFFKMERGQKLSRASLEVLAITAYRQPITRAEIDEIRGVDSGGVLRGLIEKNLVKTMGRRKAPGRPMMYGTTKRFLEYFGLAKLADLPTMEEFQKELAMLADEPDFQESLDFGRGEEPMEATVESEDSLDETFEHEVKRNEEDLELGGEDDFIGDDENQEDEIDAFRY